MEGINLGPNIVLNEEPIIWVILIPFGPPYVITVSSSFSMLFSIVFSI